MDPSAHTEPSPTPTQQPSEDELQPAATAGQSWWLVAVAGAFALSLVLLILVVGIRLVAGSG